MKNYEIEMNQVLNVLNETGALKHCIVAGSWAMYFYEHIFDSFVPREETTDLDIFLPNPKNASALDLSKRMRDIDYIEHKDYLTGKTTFLSGTGFTIEFLTTPDRTLSNTLAIPGMSIVAEALPKMAPAGWNYIEIKHNNIMLKVVSPVSFVLQKLLINSERTPEYKKEKDIEAVKYVLSFIKISGKYYDELINALDAYPKKWKRAIIKTLEQYNISLDRFK